MNNPEPPPVKPSILGGLDSALHEIANLDEAIQRLSSTVAPISDGQFLTPGTPEPKTIPINIPVFDKVSELANCIIRARLAISKITNQIVL